MKKIRSLLAYNLPGIFFGFFFTSLSAVAEVPEDFTNDVTVITADKATYDNKNLFVLLEGNVVVEDNELRLTSDRLHITFNDEKDITFIKATGQVFIQQENKNARSENADYDVVLGKITLKGDPQLQQGRDMIFAPTIIFWRDQDKLECLGGARMLYFPKEKKSSNFLFNQ